MRKEYTKPTLSVSEYEISTDVANLPSMGTTQTGQIVDGGAIWGDVQ